MLFHVISICCFLSEPDSDRLDLMSPQSPPKPARSYTFLPTSSSQASVPFSQLKFNTPWTKSEDEKRATGVLKTAQTDKVSLEGPVSMNNAFPSYDRSLPRQINGWVTTSAALNAAGSWYISQLTIGLQF